MNKRRAKTLKKIYIPLTLLQGLRVRGSWRPNKDCNILTPTLMAISVVSFSFSRCSTGGFLYHILSPTGLQTYWGAREPLLLGSGFPYHILTPTRLISNSLTSCLTELYNSSMPTQSPTQSLEWHVWSSSSRNNCHAVQRSLSSGASVYECIMGFYHVPFRQPNPPTRFLSITGH